MKLLAFICCLCMLAGAAALIYAAYNMEKATFAMVQMANDNRDTFPKLAEAEQRINVERGQLTKDVIRIRSLLKKLEAKLNGKSKPDEAGHGRAPGNKKRADE